MRTGNRKGSDQEPDTTRGHQFLVFRRKKKNNFREIIGWRQRLFFTSFCVMRRVSASYLPLLMIHLRFCFQLEKIGQKIRENYQISFPPRHTVYI